MFEDAARIADAIGRQVQPLDVEALHQTLPPAVLFPDDAVGRDAHALEEAVAGLGGVPTERAEPTDGDARQGRIDKEHADAVVATAWLGFRYHNQVVRHVRRAIVDLLTLEDVA